MSAMLDDFTNPAGPGRSRSDSRSDTGIDTRIDITQDRDVRFWCDRYEVSEAALRQAVADVGVSAEQVGDHLGVPWTTLGGRTSGSGQSREARA